MHRRFFPWAIALSMGVLSSTARAEPPKAGSLDELLEQVKGGYRSESEELKRREAEFVASRDKQKALLAEAKAKLAAMQKRGEALEREFEQNEKGLAEQEETLRIRLGNMGELFGVIRQVAGDTRAQVTSSLVSAEFPDRDQPIDDLAQSQSLPSLEQLNKLWFALQHEMTESGKVSRFKSTVVSAAGDESQRNVVRVGTFNVVSDGMYLQWLPDVRKLAELGRQPSDRFLDGVRDLEAATSGFVRFAVDPSRGSILSLLVETPTVVERIQLGGVIGYVIIALGCFALFLGFLRFLYLVYVGARVGRQVRRPKEPGNNALGRILRVQVENPGADTDTLERKLDEAIIRESGTLERALWIIKVVAVAAPLLGLLGTVTGMIRTFQAITLFGTGDPKLMAGGISEALVTTMLGLFVAIPLVLLHSGLASMASRLVGILEEQSAGIVAARVEERKAQSHADGA